MFLQNGDSMKLVLSQIRIDGGTQSRIEINNEVVSEYADLIKNGAKFPPVDVFFDGVDYWLVDGFHRYHAHQSSGLSEIDVVIKNGTLHDARYYSAGVNKSHGLRRTNADKRKSVALALAEKPEFTDNAIATHCGVSNHFVASIRSPEKKQKQNENRDKLAVKKASEMNCVENKVGSDPTSAIEKPFAMPVETQQPEQEECPPDENDIRAIFEGQEKRIAELEDLNRSLMASDKDKEIYDLKSRVRNEEEQKLNQMSLLNKKSNENDAMYRVIVQAAKFHGIDHNQSIFALCKALFPCFKKVA